MKSYFYEEALNKKIDLFGDFRLKERKKLHIWVWSSITIFILLVAAISLVSAALYAWHGAVKKDCTCLKSEVGVLESSIKGKQATHNKLLTFLKRIPDAIPSNTWLASIKYEAGLCVLQGSAFDSREVMGFNKICGGRIKTCSKKGDLFEFALEVAKIC